jgi:hypothetical protein
MPLSRRMRRPYPLDPSVSKSTPLKGECHSAARAHHVVIVFFALRSDAPESVYQPVSTAFQRSCDFQKPQRTDQTCEGFANDCNAAARVSQSSNSSTRCSAPTTPTCRPFAIAAARSHCASRWPPKPEPSTLRVRAPTPVAPVRAFLCPNFEAASFANSPKIQRQQLFG